MSQNQMSEKHTDVPSSESLELMETALCASLNTDLCGLKSRILRMSSEEFELLGSSAGAFWLHISLSTYKKIRLYSAIDQQNPPEQKETNFPWQRLRHSCYFPGENGRMLKFYLVKLIVADSVDTVTSNEQSTCDPKYLDALVQDFVSYSMATSTMISHATGTRSLDSPLTPFEKLVHENLSIVMRRCHRLRTDPRLFPSEALRLRFLYKIKRISESFRTLVEISKAYDQVLHAVCRPLATLEQTISNGVYCTISEPPKTKHISNKGSLKKLPHFLPDRAHIRHGPWSDWLHNSAIPKEGWVVIQQKIPLVGDRLSRQICLLYDAVSADFSQNGFIGEEDDNANGSNSLPSPGHEFSHFTWSAFRTEPEYGLGFKKGKRKIHDLEGKINVEHLSGILARLNGKRDGSELQSSNCPHFRFTIGFKR
jgi:hypothetical protein